MSIVAQLIAEISEPCAHCNGTGTRRYLASPTFTTMQRRSLTAQGIALPEPVVEPVDTPAQYAEATCIDCNGRGTKLSDGGRALAETLATLLAPHFAETDHGHSIS